MADEEGAQEEEDEVSRVLSMYRDVKKELDQENNLDYVAAVLAAGMLLDMKGDDEKPMNLSTLIRTIKSKLSTMTDGKVTKNDISMAKLVSSYVALSPKLEGPEEILDIWNKLRKEITLTDDLDFVYALMISSRAHGLEDSGKFAEVEAVLKRLMD